MQPARAISEHKRTILQHGLGVAYSGPFFFKNATCQPFIIHSAQINSTRYMVCSFTGKERDSETCYGYFGARYMDHELMTMWLSVDPMADKYPSITPYAYCEWNSMRLVDPNGKEISPIYDTYGNYLGTDDAGIQGKAIVMNKKNFKQGMRHDEALRFNLGSNGFSDKSSLNRFKSHYQKLQQDAHKSLAWGISVDMTLSVGLGGTMEFGFLQDQNGEWCFFRSSSNSPSIGVEASVGFNVMTFLNRSNYYRLSLDDIIGVGQNITGNLSYFSLGIGGDYSCGAVNEYLAEKYFDVKLGLGFGIGASISTTTTKRTEVSWGPIPEAITTSIFYTKPGCKR